MSLKLQAMTDHLFDAGISLKLQAMNNSWQVASAYWSRYPNPNSQHVFTEDFVEVGLDDQNRLKTKRLIMKTNSLPWYLNKLYRCAIKKAPSDVTKALDHKGSILFDETLKLPGSCNAVYSQLIPFAAFICYS